MAKKKLAKIIPKKKIVVKKKITDTDKNLVVEVLVKEEPKYVAGNLQPVNRKV